MKPVNHQRRETDEGLRTERERSDAEFYRQRAEIDGETDRGLQFAREKAAATLRAARALADDAMSSENVSDTAREAILEERTSKDQGRAQQDRTEDVARAKGRTARERSLRELVSAERDRTDGHLVEERLRADQLIESRDDFLGVVSHDLRNALGCISAGAAGILHSLGQSPNADAVDSAKLIQRNATVMALLVRDLLDTVALDAGLLSVDRRMMDARTLVNETRDAFEKIAAGKGVAIVAKSPSEPLLGSFDPVRIFQVLSNLVTNSLRHTPHGGRIEIEVVVEGSFIRFAVKDSGSGIPTSELESIFQRFVRRPTSGHLGLGLYIAKGLIASHGGRIWAESELGMGTTVFVTVPREEGAAPAR